LPDILLSLIGRRHPRQQGVLQRLGKLARECSPANIIYAGGGQPQMCHATVRPHLEQVSFAGAHRTRRHVFSSRDSRFAVFSPEAITFWVDGSCRAGKSLPAPIREFGSR
jgi:hypothetical protein